MSSLFHRRTRSASAQRPQAPTSSSAHMAATQAFLANRVSQGNLSASAAATALRTMSPPPTQVGAVQTKRMQRRSSSASLTNAPRGRGRGGLERTNSNGSMTERTFRSSPSPSRPSSSSGPLPVQVAAPPPVPKLPPNIQQPPPIPKKSQRRTVSLEAPPARVASPAFKQPGLRGSSVQPVSALSPQTNAAAIVMRQQRPAGPAGPERPESRNSINFSYPRPQSPIAQSPTSPTPRSPILRNGITAAEAERVQYGVTQGAQQPIKKKKKKVAPQAAEGSHLSSGTMASRPVATPLEPGPPAPAQLDASPAPKKKEKSAAAPSGPSSHFPPSPASTQSSDSDSTPEMARRQQRASGVLTKQPSVVKEDWEGEQEQEQVVSSPLSREAQGLSPVAETSRQVQGKKPLPAANMSRKIEEPASPTPVPAAAPVLPPTAATAPSNVASLYHAVTKPQPVSQPPQPTDPGLLAVGEPQHQRISSLSPSRSTRFSDRLASDLADGQKHEPLPRSVSPAKSALKYAPPGAVLDSSTSRLRGPSATPSDASDSNLSADGSVKRRKSARVSFEPSVEIVGTAAEQPENDSPTAFSPQHKEQVKKGLFSRAKPTLATIPSQEEIDEHMQPRPQLPSFGSVRNKTRRTDSSDSVTQKSQSKAPLLPAANIASSTSTSSDASSSSAYQGGDEGVSSDRVVGSIFARDAQQKSQQAPTTGRDPSLPLPPEVTSVEGSGYVSDADSDITVENVPAIRPPVANHVEQSQPHSSTLLATTGTTAPTTTAEAVPSLALQPPTPGTDAENPTDQWAIDLPGGFPVSNEQLPRTTAAPVNEAITKPATIEGPSTPVTASNMPVASKTGVEEEASDHDSIYSDAAEDPADLEGDGFGSIDAVVESPVVDGRTRFGSPPSSPLARLSPEDATSWEQTQQRWKGIADQTRSTSLAQPPPPSQTVPTLSQPVAKAPPKKKKKQNAATIAALGATTARETLPDSPPRMPNQGSSYPVLDNPNGSTAPMRQSMRGAPPPQQSTGQHFPKSMRNTGSTQSEQSFRQSMRATPAPAIAAPKPRPKSMPQPPPSPPTQPRATLQKRHIPPMTTQAQAAPVRSAAAKRIPPPIPDDSDSESSFRKTRKRSSSGGAYTMRTSMRAPPSKPNVPAGRGAVRSLSPPQRRPFSPPPEQKAFRSTMRSSMDTSAPTLRPQPEQKRSRSLFGRSRKAKGPTQTAVPAQPLPLTAPLRSRIGDSDDDDEPRQSGFKSRFNDSSDEEEDDRPTLRPVRGIPRKHDEGDSTDLEDSSDDEAKPQKATAVPPPINTSMAAAAPVAPAPLSPNTMKKRGLFSRFRSKKEKDDFSKSRLGVGTIKERNEILEKTAPAVEAAKKGEEKPKPENERDDEKDGADAAGFENLGFGSAAERDAIIAQTVARLEAAKAIAPKEDVTASPAVSTSVSGAPRPTSPSPASPSAGHLQRRATPQRFASDSWPLPPKIGALDELNRPSTADATPHMNGTTLRPGLGERVPTSETLKTDGGTPIVGRNGKKKRFPLLRKAFGLKD